MLCLVKEQAKVCRNQGLLFLQHGILLPGHRVAAAGHTAWYLRETQNPRYLQAPNSGTQAGCSIQFFQEKNTKPTYFQNFQLLLANNCITIPNHQLVSVELKSSQKSERLNFFK